MIDNENVHCRNCSADLDATPEDYEGDGYCADCREQRGDSRIEAAQLFVKVWAEVAHTLPDDYGCTMKCYEADALANLFRAFGDTGTAVAIIEAHAAYDEPDDDHYLETT